ncbi:hypothetical protein DMC47_45300 [Nostoc sp. 3335mG]|nr:hypothetical protein DMC47_45300 [Nostoc sp. 3335mG]
MGLQIATAAAALGWLLLAPPAQGQMLLVPLTHAAGAHLPGLAIQGNTRLIAAGPLPGSLVVEGRRADLAPLLRHSTLVLGVPLGGCRPGATA